VPDTYLGTFALLKAAAAPNIADGLSDPAWKAAVKIPVAYSVRTRRVSDDPMTVYAMTDGTSLYLAFDVTQHVPNRCDASAKRRR